jgi:hypothetical protein
LFEHPNYSPDLAPSDYTYLFVPTWRAGWDHSASTLMRSWWKESKRGWAHRRQTSLTQAYNNFFPDKTSVSIPAVTTLRSSCSIYVFSVIIKLLFLIACFDNSSPEITFRIAFLYEKWNCKYICRLFRIWGSHSGGFEEFYFLGYNAI